METRDMHAAREALFNTAAVAAVDGALLDELVQRAHASARGVFRLCLHHATSEPLQEMIVAATPRSYCQPHRHPDRSASYLLLRGAMTVFLFDDDGRVTRRVALQPPGGTQPFCLRMAAGCWHMNVATAAAAVFYEATRGPYVRDIANEYAAWAPAESDARAAALFVASLQATAAG
jgi:cupin fold WbuC family metalloprotein